MLKKFKAQDKEFTHVVYPHLDTVLMNKAYQYSNQNNESINKFIKSAMASIYEDKFIYTYEIVRENPRSKVYIKLNDNHFKAFLSFEFRQRSRILEEIIGTYINKLEKIGK